MTETQNQWEETSAEPKPRGNVTLWEPYLALAQSMHRSAMATGLPWVIWG